MAMVELVDYNEIYNPKGKKAKKSTRRGRRKKTNDSFRWFGLPCKKIILPFTKLASFFSTI